MQDVAARIGDRADIVDRRLRLRREARHVGQRIALPAHAADFLVVMRVAVGDDVEAGDLLRAHEARHRVLVLLAVARVDHRLEEALAAEHRRVPGRPRQRADDRGRQHHVGGGFEHRFLSRFWQICADCSRAMSNAVKWQRIGDFMAIDCQPARSLASISLQTSRQSGPQAGRTSCSQGIAARLRGCVSASARFCFSLSRRSAADPIRIGLEPQPDRPDGARRQAGAGRPRNLARRRQCEGRAARPAGRARLLRRPGQPRERARHLCQAAVASTRSTC